MVDYHFNGLNSKIVFHPIMICKATIKRLVFHALNLIDELTTSSKL